MDQGGVDQGRALGGSRRSGRRRTRGPRRRASGSRIGPGTPAARARGCRLPAGEAPRRAGALRRRRSPSAWSGLVDWIGRCPDPQLGAVV
jgi:hypothetical protein